MPTRVYVQSEHFPDIKLVEINDDATIDAAIASVCATMKEDRTKQRVTFYYLLAQHYGKLADLH